jgi:hypothetical protein
MYEEEVEAKPDATPLEFLSAVYMNERVALQCGSGVQWRRYCLFIPSCRWLLT